MRREGSPFQGLGTVAVKELADNLSSARMLVLELLIVLTALAALYGAIDSLRQNTAAGPVSAVAAFHGGARTTAVLCRHPRFPYSADGDRARF